MPRIAGDRLMLQVPFSALAYRLRTLLILLALGPPGIAGVWTTQRAWVQERERKAQPLFLMVTTPPAAGYESLPRTVGEWESQRRSTYEVSVTESGFEVREVERPPSTLTERILAAVGSRGRAKSVLMPYPGRCEVFLECTGGQAQTSDRRVKK